MCRYLSAIVVPTILLASIAHAQTTPEAVGSPEAPHSAVDGDYVPIPPPATPTGTLPLGYSGGKPIVNSEMLEKNKALQSSLYTLVKEGLIVDGKIPEDLDPEQKEQVQKELEKHSATLAESSTPTAKETTGNKPNPSTPEPKDSAITAELMDGQQVIFRNNGAVSIVTDGGGYLSPPDGVLTLKDGTTFNVKDGMRIE